MGAYFRNEVPVSMYFGPTKKMGVVERASAEAMIV